MQLQSQLTTAFVVPTLLAASTLAGGSQAPQSITEMINSANVSYTSTSTEAFSAAQTDEISGRLLSISKTPMAASPLTLDGQALFHSDNDPTAMLHIDTQTRTIVFNKGIGDISDHASTPALTTVEAAPQVAKSLLEELQLSPENADELRVEHVGGLNMGLEGADGETQVFEKVRTVRFGRELGGMKVIGPGSRIVVQLGQEGQMRGVVRRWNEVVSAPIAPESKFSAEQIREMITFRLAGAASEAQGIEFQSAEVVLFDDGKGVIEPAIRVEVELTFETEFRAEDGTTQQREVKNPLDFFVPILRNPKAEMPFTKDIRMNAVATPEKI